jgi:hypothetical protein
VQGLHQFNGAFGCSWCEQEGDIVEKGNGHVRVYPFVIKRQRTHDELLRCARNVTENNELIHVKGIKTVSPLFLLRTWGFDMVQSFAVDYMHCVLLGAVRQFIDLWTNSKYHASK